MIRILGGPSLSLTSPVSQNLRGISTVSPVTVPGIAEQPTIKGYNVVVPSSLVVPNAIAPTLPTQPPQLSVQPSLPIPIPKPSPRLPPIQLPGPIQPIQFKRPQETSTPTEFVPAVQVQVLSRDSSVAPYETLFQDFNVEAFPFYNFWVPDESTNDREPRGNRKLEDCPRFIKVVWNPAPDLPRPVYSQFRASNPSVRDVKPVKFGLAVSQPNVFHVKGANFLPDHLQPQNFSLIQKSLANGYIGPGIIDGIIDVPVQNFSPVGHLSQFRSSHLHQVDEETFLENPKLAGVSFHELKTNIHQLTNSVLGSSRVSSQAGTTSNDPLFSGKFGVGVSPVAGGNVQISGDGLSLVARTAQPQRGETYDHVVDIARSVIPSPVNTDVRKSVQTKVKFVEPSIDGAIDPARINLMTRPEHAESVVAISHTISQLEMFSRSGILDKKKTRYDLPSFPSPSGLKPIEYVGYILEKYQRNANGVFTKVDELGIPDRECTEFYDTKIRYGEVYRYRVRAVLRWTRPQNVGPFGLDPLQVTPPSSATRTIAPFQSSYFGSEWSNKWAYATVLDTQPPPPPDELVVRPESHRQRICVSFRIPENLQRDIFKMQLHRKLQDAHGRDITDWVQVKDDRGAPLDFDVKNVLYYDKDVQFYQDSPIRYVYAAVCFTRHGEVSPLTEQLAARLNSDYRTKGEFPVEFVSCAGVKFEHVGVFSTYPIQRMRSEVIVAPRKGDGRITFRFSGRNSYSGWYKDDVAYYARIESLDTGEKVDIPILVQYRNVKVRTDTTTSPSVVLREDLRLREQERHKAVELKEHAGLIPPRKEVSDDNIPDPLDRPDPGSRPRR